MGPFLPMLIETVELRIFKQLYVHSQITARGEGDLGREPGINA